MALRLFSNKTLIENGGSKIIVESAKMIEYDTSPTILNIYAKLDLYEFFETLI